ncbi:MAG TPA: hypothetical protein VG329_07280 [Candidatus Dormibacteraeota bacterium]|nr:hypothetical protein [Candidatus Dormibacteraeota bacterium]
MLFAVVAAGLLGGALGYTLRTPVAGSGPSQATNQQADNSAAKSNVTLPAAGPPLAHEDSHVPAQVVPSLAHEESHLPGPAPVHEDSHLP